MSAGEVEDTMYRSFVRAKPFADYTLPRSALARGQRIRRAAEEQFGDTLIEALPRGFCCVSTDMLKRTAVVHRTGSVVEAIRASGALPVLLPPVRTEDRLLVDGGILDNLPVHTLTERDEGPVIAVNISTGGSAPPSAPAGQAPVRRTLRMPSLGETLFRTMMISGGDHSSAVGTGAYVITPSSMGVGLLEFHQIDRMIASGRASARRLLDETGGDFRPAGPDH
jgi:predicted acylesterase/phospholipase RssA